MKISINAHSSIQVDNMYFDPFMIDSKMKPAKYVFITHTHYDHLSPDDISKVIDKNTTIIATPDAKDQLEPLFANKIIYVQPGDDLTLGTIQVEVFASYNKNKPFHPIDNNWVGFKITKGKTSFIVTGDSDATKTLEKLSCDILFVPIGGTYTMTAKEAANLANKMKPSIVIPMHYGSIVGSKNDEDEFKKHLAPGIDCKIYL